MDPRDELAGKAREMARRLGRDSLTLKEFKRATGLSDHAIQAHFPSWRALCLRAGLDPRRHNDPVSDDEMFAAMRDAFVEIGRVAGNAEFRRAFRHSDAVIRRRGMRWDDALRAFRGWAGDNAPGFPFFDQLPPGPPGPPRPPPVTWPLEGRELGDAIGFRGLQHAPVNEQGVVLLFGMVAAELGFLVETIAIHFPDCEAKRLIAPGRWKRVRIEFEYQSRNFRDHGHDAAGCDLIVCWRHNWPDCPIEVLALDTAIRTLPGGAAAAVG